MLSWDEQVHSERYTVGSTSPYRSAFIVSMASKTCGGPREIATVLLQFYISLFPLRGSRAGDFSEM